MLHLTKMDKRNYSVRWTQDETTNFINARIKLESLFSGKFFDLKTSWEKVGLEAEIKEDWRKLKKKWSNLMDKYKAIIEPPTGSGTEDTGPRAINWPYFEILHNYCSERHNINPPLIVDTGSEEPIPSTSASGSNTSAPNRKRHNQIDDGRERKQLKLLEKATKMYIKYMSTLVQVSDSDTD